ncbi:MAG TPA: thiamine pyrophosphate-binding protein, partial [Oligoflexia bacterium]|nr:thiamine pyrophosphate-binding protein [Oligoflexia bacterium]
MKITGSEAIWLSLINAGVDTVFGYPGGAIMPAYDALFDMGSRIRHILVRHEQGAAHAAEGYARVTGKAGVCVATSGPGATNLVTGIADAMLDSVPVVCITGQVFKDLLGTDAFQETDIIGITMPITKWNYQITDADEIPYIIQKAFFIAQYGRPGPVLLDITKNAQVEELEYESIKINSLPNFNPRPEPDEESIEKAAALINTSKKPLILAGHGVLVANA